MVVWLFMDDVLLLVLSFTGDSVTGPKDNPWDSRTEKDGGDTTSHLRERRVSVIGEMLWTTLKNQHNRNRRQTDVYRYE